MGRFITGVAACLCAATASASPGTDDMEQIWELEQVYIDTHLRAAHDELIATFHPNFLMWTSTGEPVGYEGARAYLERNYSQPKKAITRIEPVGLTRSGDVVLTHYLLHAYRKAGDSEPARTTRHSHVWVRDGTGWKLLGGMNAAAAAR